MIAGELKRLGRNMLIYGGGDVIVRFMSFLLLPLFTRYLTPSDYGVRGLLLAVAAMLTPIFSLGFGAAIGPLYFEGNKLERKAATIWTSMGLLVCSSGLMIVVGLMYSNQICRLVFQSVEYAGLFRLTLWTTALAILSEPLNLYLRFEERAKTVVLIAVLSAVFNIAVSCYLVVALHRGVHGLVVASLVGRVATLFFMIIPVTTSLRLRWENDLVIAMLKMGAPLIPSFACLYVIQQSGKYILQWERGLDAVGLYQLGMSIGLFASLVVGAFQSAWYPFFMSFVDRRDDAARIFGRTLTYYLFGAGFLVVLFFAAAKPLIMTMTHPSFFPAYRIVGLSAAGILSQGLYYVLLPPMYFAREVQWQTPIQFAAAIITAGLNFPLIRWGGGLGAAGGFLAGHLLIVLFTVAWNAFRRESYLPLPAEKRRLFTVTLVVAVLAGLFALPRNWPFALECIAGFAGVLLMAGVLYIQLDNRERAGLVCLPGLLMRRV